MKLNELGEFGLIKRLVDKLPEYGRDVIVGPGDDVAVLRTSSDKYLLATIDSQVEGIHFLFEYTGARQLGEKAIAINVSDIASMGGQPRHALVSLALPDSCQLEVVEELYEGIYSASHAYGLDVIGGNISSSRSGLLVDVCLLGEVEPENLVLRSGAAPGDGIYVTGWLGSSAAGFELLCSKLRNCDERIWEELTSSHLTPKARLYEARSLVATGAVSAMIDISDGLISDLGHILEASGVGAVVYTDRLPIATAVREVASTLGKDALRWALSGGEDYELLLTGDRRVLDGIASDNGLGGTPLTLIGEILPQSAGLQLEGLNDVSILSRGWDHFKR